MLSADLQFIELQVLTVYHEMHFRELCVNSTPIRHVQCIVITKIIRIKNNLFESGCPKYFLNYNFRRKP